MTTINTTVNLEHSFLSKTSYMSNKKVLVTSVNNFCYIKKLLDNSDDEPVLNLGQNSQSHLLKQADNLRLSCDL